MMSDERWMRLALDQAYEARVAGEVPIGAVLVKDGVVVATGRNTSLVSNDPCGHAEINALRAGAKALGNYRLDGCELFVTLEPCAMCAGAMLHARLARVVYGARDPKTGAAGSVVDLFGFSQLNHHTQVEGDVLGEACGAVLQSFFQQRRKQARRLAIPLRDDALRTAEERFARFVPQGSETNWSRSRLLRQGLRFHWLDTSANGIESDVSVLCIHGPGQWSYFFRNLYKVKNIRWIVPDLVGFGRSDKPKLRSMHTWEWHRDLLLEWLSEDCERRPVFLAYAEGAAPLVELMVSTKSTLIIKEPVFVVSDAHASDSIDAWLAPFPDRGHEAALQALGRMESTCSGPSAEQARQVADDIMANTTRAMGYCRP